MAQLSLPLAGVTVLDLTRVLAGPYCGLMLADMGADVIKVENPDGGDDTRGFLEPNLNGISTYFLTINRNKRSVALDLKSPAGTDAFLKLVAKADVVIENFRTGVMERLGLGYHVLKEHRPSLIYCYHVLRTPARLHDTVPLCPTGAPVLGEHTRDVVSTLAGLSQPELDALMAAGGGK